MRKLIMAMLCISAAMVFAGKTEPIYTGSVPYNKSMSNDEVAQAIKKALIRAPGWSIREVEGRTISAKLIVRAHEANVKISYGGGKIEIEYVSSMNLNYEEKGGEKYIHRNYNKWILNLERYISQNVLI